MRRHPIIEADAPDPRAWPQRPEESADNKPMETKPQTEWQGPSEALRRLFEHSRDALFIVRPDASDQFYLEEFNPVFAHLFGIGPRAESDSHQLLPATIPTRFTNALLRCMRSGAPARLNLSLAPAEDLIRCAFLITPVMGADGGVEWITGEGQISRSDQRRRGEEDGVQDGIARTTRDLLYVFDRSMTRSLFLNERVHAVLGYAVDEIREMTQETLKGMIHADDLPRVVAHYQKLQALPPGAVVSVEYRVRHADGHYVLLASNDTVLRTADTGATKIIGCATDITDQRHALAEVKKISKQLLRTQDEERRRIARELHDSTSQHLVAVGIDLARLELMNEHGHGAYKGSAAFQKVLAGARKSINEAQHEIRALTYLLHPPTLDRMGLAHTLRRFAAGFARRTKIHIDLSIEEGLVRPSAEIGTALLGVAQEALINVYRHSGATQVTIRLMSTDDGLTLEVEDDGKGLGRSRAMDVDELDTFGVGIPGMRARMRQFHGKLDIRSRESGVLVRATIPERAHDPD
jgi:PAS domain S-box-containing protein